MEELLYVWYEICNLITIYVIRPLLTILCFVLMLIEAGIYIISSLIKHEEMHGEDWYDNVSKAAKIHIKLMEFFDIIDY